ncbi:MAG: serine hydrolase domain-containing protein, partial [Bryobacteraceae bacterium]
MRLLLAIALLIPAFGQSPSTRDRIRAVESGLDKRMQALHVRGVSIAVIQNYQVEWAKGYGFADLESKRPVTAGTLFQAGSISKPVAAVAAMKLVEMGKLRLDDSVNTFL